MLILRKGAEEEVSITDPGMVVWALWGRKRYPAKVVLAAELPDLVRASLRKDDGKSAVVMFYGDNDYSQVNKKKLTAWSVQYGPEVG